MKRRLRLARRLHRYRAALEQQRRGNVLALRTRLSGVHQRIAETVRALERAGAEWRPNDVQADLVRIYLDGLRAQLEALLEEEAACRRELDRAIAEHAQAWREAKLAEAFRDRAERAYRQEMERREANELDDTVLRLYASRLHRAADTGQSARRWKSELSDR